MAHTNKIENNFWKKVEKTIGCWIWKAGKDLEGYGRFRVKKHTGQAHRFSYELVHGKIPKGMLVCHSCDNPSCVNPEHLFLGTHKINGKDKAIKGRAARHLGETNPMSKLKREDVLVIKSLYSKGCKQESLALRFNVGQDHISRIVNGKCWNWLTT